MYFTILKFDFICRNFSTLSIYKIDSGQCNDTDNGKTDRYGDNCADWYYDNPNDCGIFDDNDFTAILMCCACKSYGKLHSSSKLIF